MIKIVRVQHSDGLGMFWFFTLKTKKERHHCVRKICPKLQSRHIDFNTPGEDGLNIKPKWFCAYKSIEQMQKWIMPEEFAILKANGYRILMLEVSEYQIGEFQVIYTKDSVVSMTDISDLF